jgi:uncharacterized protein (DUF2126 family)
VPYPTVEVCGVSLVIVDGDSVEVDIPRADMDGVRSPVGGVGEVDAHAYRVGLDIPLEVDILEIAEHTRTPRGIAGDVRGERLHIWLEESDRLAVDIESEVERVACGENAAGNRGFSAMVVDVGVEHHGEVGGIEARPDHSVAKHRLVVADILDPQTRGLQTGLSGIKVGGIECAGGIPPEHRRVYPQRLKQVIKAEMAQIEGQQRRRVG